MLRRVFAVTTLCAALMTLSQAAVTRVDITETIGLAGYERIAGKVYFAVDPKLPANRATPWFDYRSPTAIT